MELTIAWPLIWHLVVAGAAQIGSMPEACSRRKNRVAYIHATFPMRMHVKREASRTKTTLSQSSGGLCALLKLPARDFFQLLKCGILTPGSKLKMHTSGESQGES
eukprot:1157025-Pelagomonas_calceolata.AAC.7